MLIDTDKLLPLLYEKFPDVVPDQVSDLRGLGIKVGEQKVMKYIEHIVENEAHKLEQEARRARIQ